MTARDGSRTGAPIAIVAMGAMFPGRGTTHGFFQDLIEGTDAITDVPASHWRIEDYFDPDPSLPDKTYGRRGGFLRPQAFDPVKFGLPPAALPSTDTCQLLALMVADRVMSDVEDAIGGALNKDRTSVVLGVASATELTGHMSARLQRPVWERVLKQSGLDEATTGQIADQLSAHYTNWTEATFPGLLGNVVAGRIANRLDLGGSNYVTDAACASSLSALQVAIHELRSGSSDMVLTGGVDALNDILMYLCFSKTPALSPTGDCRPFSNRADGTILGEGIGMLALKRLKDAERDGDRIHAVIRGIGGGSDGRATAIYAPLATGQARAIRRAYEDAGYGPETVGLMEAHGTGTAAGDKAELEGLHSVFGAESGGNHARCAIGSVKSQIGHTKAAAGAASMIKAAAALSRNVLLPTIKVDQPAGDLVPGSASPFYVNSVARPWVVSPATPRRASVSSFGFGGSNFHVAMEEYTGPNQPVRHRVWPAELLVFSAASREALVQAMDAANDACTSDDTLPHIAETLAEQFDPAAAVAAYMLVSSGEDIAKRRAALAASLAAGSNQGRPLPPGTGLRTHRPNPGQLAFLFAGQGSQYVGMGADLAMACPKSLNAWTEAASHADLAPLALHDKAFPARAFDDDTARKQAAVLTEMGHAQPAIAVTALAQLDLAETLGLKADMCGGHSFGELVALHHGGAISRADLLSLAHARAQAMTNAASTAEGAMLAVRAHAGALTARLENHPGIVLANDNSPQQVALSGRVAEIDAIQADLKLDGFTTRRLPVATAFHSPIVDGAVAPFRGAIDNARVEPPRIPVYANATARPYAQAPSHVKAMLANQVRQPVRFREMVEAMHARGARTFVEFGPGSVLQGLVTDTLDDPEVTVVSMDRKGRNGVESLLDTLGTLAISGQSLDLTAFYRDHPAPPSTAPPGKFSVSICGANYGKPDPAPAGIIIGAPESDALASSARPQAAPTPTKPSIPPPSRPTPPEKKTAMTEAQLSSPTITDPASIAGLVAEISATHRQYLETIVALTGAMQGVSPVQNDAPPATAPTNGAETMNGRAATNGHANNGAELSRGGENGAALPRQKPVSRHAAPPAPLNTKPPRIRDATPPPTSGPSEADLIDTLRSIIAEKTGYPDEMLEADMHLEAELGIDSIKQVEILSAIQERHPTLPEIAPDDVVELTTIALIAAYLSHGGGTDTTPEPSPAPAPEARAKPSPAPRDLTLETPRTPSQAPAPASTNGSAEIANLLKSLIAEKTGYPEDMLEDDMDLESELGIDSIKQVEVLSALQDARPDLPAIDPDQMAELRSIADLAGYFR